MQYNPRCFTPQQAYNEISSKAVFKTHANENFIWLKNKLNNFGRGIVQWSSFNKCKFTINCMLPHMNKVMGI